MAKWDTLHRINGLYVGMLDDEEMVIFDAACVSHEARRDFDHPGGLLGLAKVALIRTTPALLPQQSVTTEGGAEG